MGDLRSLERRYLEMVVEKYKSLEVEGEGYFPLFDVFMELQTLRNERGFVTGVNQRTFQATARKAYRARITKVASGLEEEHLRLEGLWRAEGDAYQTPVPLSVALAENMHLVLLGEPGAGKSTTLQFIALQSAQLHITTKDIHGMQLDLSEDMVPVLLSLREEAIQIGQYGLMAPLVNVVRDIAGIERPQAEQLIDGWWKQGRLAVLLDGLDEVPETAKPRISDILADFARLPESRQCRIVVTSRPAGYGPFRDHFGEYDLLPLKDPDQVKLFATLWLGALRSMRREATGKGVEQEAANLLVQLQNHPSLARILDNPLLLRMTISVYQSGRKVPRNWADIYGSYIEKVAWERAKLREDPLIDLDTALEVLQVIAWIILTEGEQSSDALAARVRLKLGREEDARHLVRFLWQSMGLLKSRATDSEFRLGFSQLPFLEYFVARRLEKAWAKDPEETWRFLERRLHHPAWREPVLLLSTMIRSQESTSELVRNILNASSRYEQHLYRDLLLAGECLGRDAHIDVELRDTILERLAHLYVDVMQHATQYPTRFPDPPRILAQPIEDIVVSLGNEERKSVAAALLGRIQEKGSSKRFHYATLLESFAFTTREFIFLIRYLFGIAIEQPLLREPLTTRFRETIRGVVSLPRDLIRHMTWSRISQFRAVSKAIKKLDLRDPEMSSVLVRALEQPALRGAAAEALGRIGAGYPEIVYTLLGAQEKHRWVFGWDDTVTSIVEALGALGQRYDEVVELLLEIVSQPESKGEAPDLHYPVAMALSKAAEVNVRAMTFILKGWKHLSGTGSAGELDEGTREGLKEGRKLITSASVEVIQYLLDELREDKDPRLGAWAFLEPLLGNSPLVQCRVADENGGLRYRSVDFANEVFSILEKGPLASSSNAILQVITRWGLNSPDIVVRLINLVRNADPWILADLLESCLEPPHFSSQPVERKARAFLEKSILALRSSDRSEQDAEFKQLMKLGQAAPEDNWFFSLTPSIVSREKCRILYQAYGAVVHTVYAMWDRWKWRDEQVEGIDPYVMAALACFRGWYWASGFTTGLSLTWEEAQSEFAKGSEKALSILQGRDERAIETLSSMLTGEEPKLNDHDLLRQLVEEDQLVSRRGEGLLAFQERISAAYSLARLSRDHSEAQAVLTATILPHLEVLMGDERLDDDRFFESEVREHWVHALGYFSKPGHNVIAALLEITAKYDNHLYGAGCRALSRLENLNPEEVSLLMEWYEKVDERICPALIKALGGANQIAPEIVALWLNAVEEEDFMIRAAAATELGKLQHVDVNLLEALFPIIGDTTEAAVAVGKLAGHIAPGYVSRRNHILTRVRKGMNKALNRTTRNISRPSDEFVYGILKKVARVLQKALNRPAFNFSRGGYEALLEALNRVADQITLMEIQTPPTTLEILGGDGFLVDTWARPVSRTILAAGVIVGAILALSTNIVAEYLQTRYELITDPTRFVMVLTIFFFTLLATVGLALRLRSVSVP